MNQAASASAASGDLCIVATESEAPSVPETAFQSETSFDSHSVQASVTAEYSAAEVVHNDLDQEIHASLTALKSLLRDQGAPSSSNNLSFPRAVTRSNVPKVELPPMPVIIEVLKKASCEFSIHAKCFLVVSNTFTSTNTAGNSAQRVARRFTA